MCSSEYQFLKLFRRLNNHRKITSLSVIICANDVRTKTHFIDCVVFYSVNNAINTDPNVLPMHIVA